MVNYQSKKFLDQYVLYIHRNLPDVLSVNEHSYMCTLYTLYAYHPFPQAWNVKDGHEISSSSGRGLGVRPCVFFSDNVRVASAADDGVLVNT